VRERPGGGVVAVDTDKIRRYVSEYADAVGEAFMLRDVMGVKGRDLMELLDVYDASREDGQSFHTGDANCRAGDCDDCNAREALAKLESIVGDPRVNYRAQHKGK
jgi:hypothetical protein